MAHGITDALLIYNPTSGRGRNRRFAEIEQSVRVLKEAGIQVELASTTARGHARELARHAVEQNRGMVIACGGDGTVNEIMNGLAGSQVPLVFVPVPRFRSHRNSVQCSLRQQTSHSPGCRNE